MSAHEGGITKPIIYKTLAILSIVTIVEIGVALTLGETLPKLFMDGFFIILSLLKAFYIVAEFMHLKYEKKAFTFWTLASLLLLVWFIISMTYEGSYWHLLRS